MMTNCDWHDIGIDQGVQAGNADKHAVYDFGLHENNLAHAHALLGGEYALVTRKYRDFPDHDCCSAWMAGVIEGSSSVGARMAYSTGTPDLASGVKGAMRLHLMIVIDLRSPSTAI
ncbi:hypothetical protein [Rhizobium rhizogenes]|uniref:hypothetical protein n=1 Tax=Rhizobium rhizogenes TaxID=359 RepID=UPI0015742E46|nr:hypothetical protein [Rhizobium rhizogenes]NTF49110.1 hypothetical protein [Rhizobium rhizogenes]NTH06494.1 hypothetical protein [Rhizobium rhizogenes]